MRLRCAVDDPFSLHQTGRDVPVFGLSGAKTRFRKGTRTVSRSPPQSGNCCTIRSNISPAAARNIFASTFDTKGTKTGKGITESGFNKAWRKARIAAGCPGRIPHDFRRTAVRNLVRAGVLERVAMQLTGHKTRAVFERYNIVSPGDLRNAARRLDSYASRPAMQASDASR